jgi:hypothetical protein
MRPSVGICGALLPLCIVLACADSPNLTEPTEVSAVTQVSTSGNGPSFAQETGGRRILMLDQCDPDSFNEAIGPGTCVNRNGGLSFDLFIALLQNHQRAPSWRFSPETIHVPRDLTLPIVNAGGEVHTFTEVEEFGGGIVPVLNNLTGNTVVAPECLTLGASDFIPAGGQTTHTFEPGEADKYQCCIHPWMRAVVR